GPGGPGGGDGAETVAELRRRLRLIEEAGEAAFGPFTAADWTICVVLFVLLPALLFAWAG
ncbi:MAG: hypothetical protein ACRD6R_11660, partial [Candidatus Polarisedimenticolia bacterium]